MPISLKREALLSKGIQGNANTAKSSPDCAIREAHEPRVRAAVNGTHAPLVLASRHPKPEVFEQESGRVDHQQDGCSHDAQGRAVSLPERCRYVLVGPAGPAHIVLDQVAQHRQHDGKLQRVAEQQASWREVQPQEGGPASGTPDEGQRHDHAHARQSQNQSVAVELLAFLDVVSATNLVGAQ